MPERSGGYWPITLVQIVGGKTWSISFVRFRTPEPIPVNTLEVDSADTKGVV